MTTSADWAITPELINAIQALERHDYTDKILVQRRNEMGQIEEYYVPAYLMKRHESN